MRWTCADCRREWIFSTASAGQAGCCPACGSASITQVTFVGDFDSTTTPQDIADAMQSDTEQHQQHQHRLRQHGVHDYTLRSASPLSLSSPEFA